MIGMEKLGKERILEEMNNAKKDRNHYGYIAILSAILVASLWQASTIASLLFLACIIYEYNKFRKANKEYNKWKNKL
jgi:hypothetical protein